MLGSNAAQPSSSPVARAPTYRKPRWRPTARRSGENSTRCYGGQWSFGNATFAQDASRHPSPRSPGETPDAPQLEDRIVINAVRHGTWRFTDPGGGDAAVASTGRFVVRAPWRSTRITTAPGTRVTVLVVPVEELGRDVAEKSPTGSLASPEARVLMAHVATVGEVIDGLSAQGLAATRDALVELARGRCVAGSTTPSRRLRPRSPARP
jgi:hypothetical protein